MARSYITTVPELTGDNATSVRYNAGCDTSKSAFDGVRPSREHVPRRPRMTVQTSTQAAGAIVAATDSALAELDALLAASERVTLHGDDAHQWSASDVWAHVGRWLGVSAELVGRHLAGERDIHDYDGGGEEFNLRWIEEDRALDVGEARSRALDSWDRLRGVIAGVDEARWNGFIEAHAKGNGADHVLEHLGYVVSASGVTGALEAEQQLERDREAWVRLVAALDARPGVALHDPEAPAWKSREVFGHFAHWLEHSAADFVAQLDGGEAPALEGDDDEINARWAAEDAAFDLATMRERALRAFADRSRLILATPADRWTQRLLKIAAADGEEHIEAHLGYVEGGEA
jgi:hypothetical protein